MEITTKYGLLTLSLALIITSCAQTQLATVSPEKPAPLAQNSTPQIPTQQLTNKIEKSVNVTASYTVQKNEVKNADYVLTSIDKKREIGTKGSVTVNTTPGQLSLAFLVKNDTYIAMDVIIPGKKDTLAFNASNSAKAFIITDPLFIGWGKKERLEVYDRLNKHPRLEELARTFDRAKGIVEDQETINLVNSIAYDIATAYYKEKTGKDFKQKDGLQSQGVIRQFDYAPILNWNVTQTGAKAIVTGNSLLATNAFLIESSNMHPSGDPSLSKSESSSFVGAPNAETGYGFIDLAINAGGSGTSLGQSASFDLPVTTERKVYNIVMSATRADPSREFLNPTFANAFDVTSDIFGLMGFRLEGNVDAARQFALVKLIGQSFLNITTGALMEDAIAKGDNVAILAQVVVFARQNAASIAELAGVSQENFMELITRRLIKAATIDAVMKPAQLAYLASHITSFIWAYNNENDGKFNYATVAFVPPAINLFNFSGPPVSVPTCSNDPINGSREYELVVDGISPESSNVWVKHLRMLLNGGEIALRDGGQQESVELRVKRQLRPGTYTLSGVAESVTADGKPLTINKSSTFTVPEIQNPPPCDEPEPEPDPIPEPDEDDGTGTSFGDPHLSTYESRVYSFQAVGEFVLSRSTHPRDTFEVQTRYEALTDSMSANAAVAMKVGEDRVGLYATKGNEMRVRINGQLIALDGGKLTRSLPFGGYITVNNDTATVSWPDGSTVYAELLAGTMGRITVKTPATRRRHLVGLLGNFDGNRDNDFVLRNGQVLPSDLEQQKIYTRFGEDWRLSQEESLFDYENGQSTHSFTNRAFPARVMTLASLQPQARQEAQHTCTAAGIVSPAILQKCTLDVAITGNKDWAFIAAGVDPNIKGITLTPNMAVMLPGTTRKFGALVTGRLNDRTVKWNIQSGQTNFITSNIMEYTAPTVPGTYRITASLSEDGTIQKSFDVVVVEPAAQVTGETRFILRWLEQPLDLDAHLWLPASNPYHLYYYREGNDDVCPNASLDVDDTDGHGPEIVRVKNRIGDGNYELVVHNYSGDYSFSGAEVEITDQNGTAAIIKAPQNAQGIGEWWHVLSMDAKTGKIVQVNQIVEGYEPYFDTSVGCGDLGEGNQPTGTMNSLSLQITPKPAWIPGTSNIKK